MIFSLFFLVLSFALISCNESKFLFTNITESFSRSKKPHNPANHLFLLIVLYFVEKFLVGTDEYDTIDLNIETTPVIREYISMTPDQRKEFCMDVLKVVEHCHDCNIGVNWEVLNITAQKIMNERISIEGEK
ncbi:hypothetical protein [Xenorhabdus sp. TH1]|uniref:hypothetical protein n=1 Tax=Xenorhabdus sp. TH1 TaxID=3130166 RepID=UPI0030D5DDE8